MSGVEETRVGYLAESNFMPETPASSQNHNLQFLGELISLEYGSSLPEQIRSGNGFPVYGSNGVVGYHSKYYVEGPGIIVGRKGSVGEVSWSDDNFWPIDTSYFVQPKGQLDLRWLFWSLKAARLNELDAATGVPGLSRHDAYAVRVFFPSYEEQRRIAVVLDAIDAAIEKSEALIAKLKQVRAGMLHDLLTCGMDENGEIRDPLRDHHRFIPTEFGFLPKEWQTESVGALFEMQLGKMLNQKARLSNSPLPYLTNRHVQWGRVDCDDLEYMDFSADERNKFRLKAGDLLVCEGGEVGRTAIWRDEIEDCYFQKALHRLRPKDGRIIPEYMLVYMQQAAQTGRFLHLTVQTSIAHLPQEKLALLKVVLPPRDEQERMAEIWTSLDDEIEECQGTHAKLNQIKQGLSADLLTGQVRIPPDLELP